MVVVALQSLINKAPLITLKLILKYDPKKCLFEITADEDVIDTTKRQTSNTQSASLSI